MDAISDMVSALAGTTPLYGMFLAFLVFLGGCLWYYMAKILKPRTEEKEKRETASVKNQTHSLNLLQKTVDSNEGVTKQLVSTMNRLDLTLEKVSDKLSSIDERTVKDSIVLNDINNNMPSKDNVNRLHERINGLIGVMADKDDVIQLKAALADLCVQMGKANESLVEIKAKQD